MTLLRVQKPGKQSGPQFQPAPTGKCEVLEEDTFNRMIAIERKRTERTKQPFLLMLIETGRQQGASLNGGSLDSIVSGLLSSVRETDIIGWYKGRTIVGVIYSGLVVNDKNSVLSMILKRVSTVLGDKLTSEQFSQVSISFHFFPDDWAEKSSGRPSNPALYPDLLSSSKGRRVVTLIKRAMDIAGGAIMLILCAPMLLIIAVAIKVSSKGPVFFRQT